MKILFIDNSGLISRDDDFCIESKTGDFTLELKNIGNEITFYGQKLKPSETTIHVFGIKKNGMKVCGLKRKKNKLLNYILLYLCVIPAVYKSDFVYIFYPNAFKYVAFIANLLRKKFGIYIRGMEDLDDKASHWIYKHAFTIFTVSEDFTNFINSIVKKEIASTIRPMIPFTENDIIKNRIYENKDKYVFLYLGRTSDDKGLIELLNAISILKESRNDFYLNIVGNGEYFEQLKELTNHLSLFEYVNFTGGVYGPNKIKKYYLDADIYILPTYHEGFPRTLYEAMIFGTPIITTFVGGISSHMINNENCLKIEPKSVDSIVNALTFAMNNYNHMGKLAKNGMITVAKIVDSKRLTHAQDLNNKITLIK